LSLRDVLLRVGQEFPIARRTSFGANLLGIFVRNDAESELASALGELARGLVCKGSVGAGKWAEVPWLAVFDPLVTTSATRGYYVVYLFGAEGEFVHLSLNQGTTAVRREFGEQARAVLKDRAAMVRARLPDFASGFSDADVNLGSSLALPRDYEAGHAFGRSYSLAALPAEEELRTELQAAVRAYLALT
jgi:5-methylcytosine-specific restriction protein A